MKAHLYGRSASGPTDGSQSNPSPRPATPGLAKDCKNVLAISKCRTSALKQADILVMDSSS
jgi:hypothetical protein